MFWRVDWKTFSVGSSVFSVRRSLNKNKWRGSRQRIFREIISYFMSTDFQSKPSKEFLLLNRLNDVFSFYSIRWTSTDLSRLILLWLQAKNKNNSIINMNINRQSIRLATAWWNLRNITILSFASIAMHFDLFLIPGIPSERRKEKFSDENSSKWFDRWLIEVDARKFFVFYFDTCSKALSVRFSYVYHNCHRRHLIRPFFVCSSSLNSGRDRSMEMFRWRLLLWSFSSPDCNDR